MAIQISDGTTVPHAANYTDLLSKLIAFATSGSNGWTQLESSAEKTVLRGSGSGTDQIYVGFRTYSNIANDVYGWDLQGYTGYTNAATNFMNQPGAITAGGENGASYPSVALWNSTIPYWFVINPRRIMMVAKVQTTYHFAYLGFFLPFATPGQYPYPLFVGGSFMNNYYQQAYRFSYTACSAFWSGINANGVSASCTARMQDGTWQNFSNQVSTYYSHGMYPYNQNYISLKRPNLDGSYTLTPVELQRYRDSNPRYNDRLGELDGVYHVTGFGQAAENIITVAGENYLVVPDVFRTNTANYAAIKLV